MASVRGKVIVFFGGSSKIFLDSINELLFNGATIYSLDAHISSAIKALKVRYPDSLHIGEVDITKEREVQLALDSVVRLVGSFDCVINAAAIDNPPNSDSNNTGRFEDLNLQTWNDILDVNLTGAFLIAKYFGGYMAERKNGSLIFVSSIYSLVSPDQSLYECSRTADKVFFKPVTYSVTKAGVNMLSKYLATYWAKKNIRVNCLVLSGIDGNQDGKFKDVYCQRIPIGRMAKPSEIFEPLSLLISDGSSYLTGQNLVVDGGWTAI